MDATRVPLLGEGVDRPIMANGSKPRHVIVRQDLTVKQGHHVKEETLGMVVKESDDGWTVAFDGLRYNVTVPPSEVHKLEGIQQEPLTPISMLHAALRVGCFFDLWQTDRQKAVHSLREFRSHPLRGLFLPADEETLDYDMDYKRASTSFELKATMSCAMPPGDVFWDHVLQCAVWLGTALGVQFYASFFLKDPCGHDDDGPSIPCKFYSFVEMPFVVFALSTVWFLLATAAWRFWTEHYASVTACSPIQIKKLRYLLVVNIWDKLGLDCLPTVAGNRKDILLSGYLALLAPYSVIAVFMQDVGIFAFGKIVADCFLTAANAVCGESGSMKQVRESKIQTLLADAGQKAHIDMKEPELLRGLHEFLTHPPSHDTIVIDLRLFVLLANVVVGEDLGCIRLRRFIIKGAYGEVSQAEEAFAQNRDQPRWMGEITGVRNVIVDTFSGEIQVDGGAQGHARWMRMSQPIPWHLAMRPDATAEAQFTLCALGMKPGSSAFAPGPVTQPHWENWEAQSRAEWYLHIARQANEEVGMLSDVLIRLLKLESFDDERDAHLIEALVRMGARVNDDQTNGNACRALFFCIQKNRYNSALRLMDLKADVAHEYMIDQKVGVETPLQAAVRLGTSHIADELRLRQPQAG